jgi:hypothetical protein
MLGRGDGHEEHCVVQHAAVDGCGPIGDRGWLPLRVEKLCTVAMQLGFW